MEEARNRVLDRSQPTELQGLLIPVAKHHSVLECCLTDGLWSHFRLDRVDYWPKRGHCVHMARNWLRGSRTNKVVEAGLDVGWTRAGGDCLPKPAGE
jgi:hypothetical protein